jgi:hypothetical protein
MKASEMMTAGNICATVRTESSDFFLTILLTANRTCAAAATDWDANRGRRSGGNTPRAPGA